MENIPTKKAGDFTLPVLGFGTYKLGGHYELNEDFSLDKGADLIKQAYEIGYRHFDTAARYIYGDAEKMIGKAIAGGLPREDLFITSKVPGNHLKYDEVIKDCEESLQRLGTDKLDLYLIHWPDDNVPLEETIKAMDFLLENEKIQYIGVSNFSKDRLQQAISLTKYQIVNNQIHYNLQAREYENNSTLEFCRENQILVTAYSPLGNVAEGNLAKTDNDLIKTLAEKYNASTAQIALAWLYKQPGVVTIVKSETPKYIKENFESVNINLTDDETEWLSRDFPRGQTRYVD